MFSIHLTGKPATHKAAVGQWDEQSKTMSTNQSTVWAENCYDNFLVACNEGDWVQALACIGDMHDVFPSWAEEMKKELHDFNISLFAKTV